MSDLEARYRRALAWYPREWRQRNEDVALGTLLDVADSGESSRLGELTALRVNGIRERVNAIPSLSAPIRERAALVGYGANSAIAVAMLIGMLWQWTHPLPEMQMIDGESVIWRSTFDSPQVALITMYSAMIVAGAFALSGLARAGSIAIIVVLLLAVTALVTTGPVALTHLVIVASLAAASLLRPRSSGAVVHPGTSFLAVFGVAFAIIPIGLGVLALFNLRYSGRIDELVFNSSSITHGWIVIASVAALTMLIRRSPHWAVAILMPFAAPFALWAVMAFIIPDGLVSPYSLSLVAYLVLASMSVAVLASRRARRGRSATGS